MEEGASYMINRASVPGTLPLEMSATTSKDAHDDGNKLEEVSVAMPDGDKKIDVSRYMLFSCISCWCCNILFGGIAFLVARSGKNASHDKARRLMKASCYLNIIGMLVTWVILAVILALYFTHRLGNYLPYYST